MTVKRVAVYCGSANGSDPAFLAEAKQLGRAIAEAGLGLVYGGASVGLMGAVADAALAGGAEVIGVLPEILSGSEIAHGGLTRLEFVATMHERKARMVKLADAFLMLPGGYGTLDEMMEILTLMQTRKIDRRIPVILFGSSYWREIVDFEALARYGMIDPGDLQLFHWADEPSEALALLQNGIAAEFDDRMPAVAHSKTPSR